MLRLERPSQRPALPADSRAHELCRTAFCARSISRRSTIAGRNSARLTLEILERLKQVFQTRRSSRHLSCVGHRCVGGRAGQHALARRSSTDVRNRPLRDALAQDRRQAGARRRLRSRRLAQRRRPCRRRGATRRGQGARDQGGAASCTTRRRPASPAGSPRSGRRSIAAGHPALLMVDTISDSAHRSTIATPSGASTSASRARRRGSMLPPGSVVQRRQRQGARGQQGVAPAEDRTGAGTRSSR